jgi:ribosomal protein S28E/S33
MKNIEMRFLTIFQILGRVQCNGKVGQVVVYILHVVAKEKT